MSLSAKKPATKKGRPGGPLNWIKRTKGWVWPIRAEDPSHPHDPAAVGRTQRRDESWTQPTGRMEFLLWARRRGLQITKAVKLAGLPQSTYFQWLKRGQEEESGEFREFSDRLEGARSTGELHLLDQVTRAAEGDWRAAKYLLSVMDPSRYSERTLGLLDDGADELMAERDFTNVGRTQAQAKIELAVKFRLAMDRLEPVGVDLKPSGKKGRAAKKGAKR